jgi:hypothetical protein
MLRPGDIASKHMANAAYEAPKKNAVRQSLLVTAASDGVYRSH